MVRKPDHFTNLDLGVLSEERLRNSYFCRTLPVCVRNNVRTTLPTIHVFSGCVHAPAGCTVIIGQPTSNLGPDSPEGQGQPIPLAMAMPPAQTERPGGPAGEEHSGETLPESK